MRENCRTWLTSHCFLGEETAPWQAYKAAQVARMIVASANFSLIACTVFLSGCPPVLLTIVPCVLLLNALLSTFQVLCARYKAQFRIEALSEVERGVYFSMLEVTMENSDSAYFERWQTFFAVSSMLLIIAAWGLCFFQLPAVVSVGIICFFLLAYSMKSIVSLVVEGKDNKINSLLSSIVMCLSIFAAVLLPMVIPFPFLAPWMVGGLYAINFLLWGILPEEVLFVTVNISVCCIIGLSIQFAAAPALTMLASLLAINVTTCFIGDSLVHGLNRAIKRFLHKEAREKKCYTVVPHGQAVLIHLRGGCTGVVNYFVILLSHQLQLERILEAISFLGWRFPHRVLGCSLGRRQGF